MHRHQKESEQLGKKSFAFAFVMDESQAERERGVTINCAQRTFVTSKTNRRICLVDAPGHADFIPNM
jgi:elongation factor 1 alpha-like protein